MEDKEYLKRLAKERLQALPPEVSFSVGQFGDYTRDELIAEVEKGSEVGKAAIEMQLAFIRRMPKMVSIP